MFLAMDMCTWHDITSVPQNQKESFQRFLIISLIDLKVGLNIVII